MSRGTKYLMSKGELRRKDNSIVFRNEKGNHYLPIESTREIYCMDEVSINTKFLDFAAKAGITIHFFNHYGYYSGSFYPKENLVSGKLTIGQANTYMNNRIPIAKAIVKGIANNVHEVLYHYYKHDKKEVKPTLDWLKKDASRYISNENINIKQVLAVEGEIWYRFYNSFQYFLPEDFLLNKRVKRPPDNPMNALISFGNSILYSKTISQIYKTHLNQTISYLHEPSKGRFSLSLDLSEVFKPVIVYKTIFDLVNNRRLQVGKHFEKKLNYCVLNEEGRRKFVQAMEERFENVFYHERLKRKVTYRTAIKLDGYKLIKFILEDKPFIPFSLKEKI